MRASAVAAQAEQTKTAKYAHLDKSSLCPGGCGDFWCAGPGGPSVPKGAGTPLQGSNRGVAVTAVLSPASVCGGAVGECTSRAGIFRGDPWTWTWGTFDCFLGESMDLGAKCTIV